MFFNFIGYLIATKQNKEENENKLKINDVVIVIKSSFGGVKNDIRVE